VTSQLIINSVVTLLAVWLGAGLSLVTQTRALARESSQHWRSARLASYSRFLGAMRAYLTYTRQARDGGAASDGSALAYVERAEVALAEVQLLARNEETVERAVALLDAVQAVAGRDAAAPDGPDDDLQRCRVAEQEFLAAARREVKAGGRPATTR
jgi:hypothetical protein